MLLAVSLSCGPPALEPTLLSASVCQTWARGEGRYVTGCFNLQRLCFKALKIHLVVVVAVKSALCVSKEGCSCPESALSPF